ncbi:MAG: hypothetical protein H0V35_07110 [Nitrospira sp.]|nr:hypothetical protein [Nitrospira sp.]
MPWVFFRVTGKGIQPIHSYKTAWGKSCLLAGVPEKLVHDFRGTAVRNLRRAGVSQTEAMKLTGHLTISVFQRYDKIEEADLCAAVDKLAAFHAQAPLRDNYGTIVPIQAKAGVQ